MRFMLSAAAIAALTLLTPINATARGPEHDHSAQEPAKPQITLRIGDKAPTLEGAAWLQGEPVSSWQNGTVYILDFWATWCGPCIKTIPEVNALHGEFKDKNVRVIGVAIWPQDGMVPTAEFVKQQGEKMSYGIAEDNKSGAVATAFMTASGQQGIPTVMIVNRDGRLAWLGHPMMGMRKALDQIIAGTYDVDAAAAKQKKDIETEEKAEPLLMEANTLAAAGKWEEALAKVDALIELGYQPAQLTLARAQVMMGQLNKFDEAYTYLGKALDGPLGEEPMLLNQLAWFIAAAPELPKRDLPLARRAIEKANTLTGGKDAPILDTYARVLHAQGEHAKAAETVGKALELADESMREEMQESLDVYKAAAEKTKAGGAEPADASGSK